MTRWTKTKRRALTPGYAVVLVGLVAISGWASESRPVGTFEVVSSSMQPTLFQGDDVLSVSADWWAAPPQPGDLVVFYPPSRIGSEIPVVKRIVAHGGDVVAIRHGTLYVNGRSHVEPYARSYSRDYHYGPLQVPPGTVFVLGDNRAISEDSTTYGPVPLSRIERVVWLRVDGWGRFCSPSAVPATALPQC